MYKRIIAAAICVLGTAGISQAQLSPDNRLSIGAKVGFNYSNVWDEEGQDFRADPKLGFVGGGFLSIPLTDLFGFQPEFLISQKGFQGSGSLLGTPYSFSRTSTHIDIPLQLMIRPVPAITLLVGPQFSYLLSTKNVYSLGSITSAQEEQFNNDNLRKNMLGFVMGADVSVSHFVVSGKLGWDFQHNHGDGTASTPRYKNRWIQLALGFRL